MKGIHTLSIMENLHPSLLRMEGVMQQMYQQSELPTSVALEKTGAVVPNVGLKRAASGAPAQLTQDDVSSNSRPRVAFTDITNQTLARQEDKVRAGFEGSV